MNETFKIALLCGAVKNAGDYLIVERSKALLKHIYPSCEIEEFQRNKDLTGDLDAVNSCKVLIIAGGPGYFPGFYPRMMPLAPDLSLIKIPIFILGMGWWAADTSPETIYAYQMDDKMLSLLQRVTADTGVLGCRDWYSVNALRNSGLMNGMMTGCPAWYDLEALDKLSLWPEKKELAHAKKICVSDPGQTCNFAHMEQLVQYLRDNFSDAEIICVFHRGPKLDRYTDPGVADMQKELMQRLLNMGAKCRDISYGADGFQVYEDCDLHIGFRVHAHIYNLSRRNISILIEEDGRGGGVNDALGLERIMACQKAAGGGYKSNGLLLFQVEDALVNLMDSGFLRIEHAFGMMRRYYDGMEKHIKSISKCL